MGRRAFVVVVGVLVVTVGVAGGVAAWATSYDQRNASRLMPGTVVEGVDVGGLRTGDAVRVLKDRIEAPLHRVLTVKAGAVEVATSPWDLGLRVDVRAAVRQAAG